MSRRARGYGGKARNLAVLARAGVPVPWTYALSASVGLRFLRRTLPGSDWVQTILSDRRDVSEARLASIRARIAESELPVGLRHDVRECLREARDLGIEAFAVRSSALHEDQLDKSAAGLHSSFINVRDERDVFDAIKGCWMSLYQQEVIQYMFRLEAVDDGAVGVMLQELVPADSSGVLFTANPMTGDPNEFVINSTYGLGVTVTDGSVSPDVIRLDRHTDVFRDVIMGEKAEMAVPGPAGGLLRVVVPADKRRVLAIDDAMVREVAALGRRAESLFGTPQDIEWAVRGGRLWALQSRPITRMATRSEGAAKGSRQRRHQVVWSNVNVGEALPGVVSPLTWSVLKSFSAAGFRRAFGAMGCAVPPDAELVGNFRGRIYLNLTELMEIASQVPGVTPDLLLSLGGGAEAAKLLAPVPEPSRAGFYARLPWTVSRFVRENLKLTERVASASEDYIAEHGRMRHTDLRLLSPAALDRTLWDVERMLHRTGGAMLRVYGSLLLLSVTLRGLFRGTVRHAQPGAEQALLRGIDPGVGAAPGIALREIAALVRSDVAARSAILGTPLAELRVTSLPAGRVREALHAFFDAHGFRGPREAELMEPRWGEAPEIIFAALRSQVADDGARSTAASMRPPSGEGNDELLGQFPMLVRPLAAPLLARVQSLVSTREQMRAQVAEILSLYRAVALDSSRRLAAEDPRVGENAAFFLHVDELHAYLSGRVTRLGSVVEHRRRHFARDCALPSPPAAFVGVPPAEASVPTGGDSVTGLAASGGYIEGRARVISNVHEAAGLSSEEILVVPHADIGWSPYFTIARAVVTELGGPLSHAAIVLREYGVPAVVNAVGATRIIRQGDRIAVDGDRGVVRVLERAAESKGPVSGG